MKKTIKILTVSSIIYLSTATISSAFAWGLSSTGQQIGNFYYENFSNGMSCTTQVIGEFTYTNCF
tara:strand:+ start:926 stop:1120 length:195 start_codon:yes stop_codon:yes gene_type:complete